MARVRFLELWAIQAGGVGGETRALVTASGDILVTGSGDTLIG